MIWITKETKLLLQQVDTKWVYHYELKANEKCVYDGEAKQIGQILFDHKIVINYCPFCGEKLNRESQKGFLPNSRLHFHNP